MPDEKAGHPGLYPGDPEEYLPDDEPEAGGMPDDDGWIALRKDSDAGQARVVRDRSSQRRRSKANGRGSKKKTQLNRKRKSRGKR